MPGVFYRHPITIPEKVVMDVTNTAPLGYRMEVGHSKYIVKTPRKIPAYNVEILNIEHEYLDPHVYPIIDGAIHILNAIRASAKGKESKEFAQRGIEIISSFRDIIHQLDSRKRESYYELKINLSSNFMWSFGDSAGQFMSELVKFNREHTKSLFYNPKNKIEIYKQIEKVKMLQVTLSDIYIQEGFHRYADPVSKHSA